MISGRNKCPFTPNQWQQLAHQALIFKFMVSGVPIPPQLIYSVKTSFDSSLPPNLFPQQRTGCGCFQEGYGRKPDPEPGRCRRTDGKKWRCSKEAYPDSKYCERHMHRGRNRSRKPVQVYAAAASSSSSTTGGSTLSTSFPSINNNLSISICNTTSSFSFPPTPSETYTHFDPFLYSPSSSSTRLPGPGLSVPSHPFLDPATGLDYRYVHGTREAVDERSFFPEASGSARVVPYSYPPLSMVQSFGEQEQHQQCFVLGTDIKSAKPIKLEKDEETQKPVHQILRELDTREQQQQWVLIVEVSIMESIKALE
ncbi:growth-regulating factor 5-like isoform X1 [Hibiscus syriacus]|uniref:growth-regulating factor 5-like isoform X1 n=1 Tax=Hibiscus syriacus TaxID=106335 RepID=UPI0019244BF1|nr:growth-regulating factor 5-like isoform X1 [Hibiscus syriacus]